MQEFDSVILGAGPAGMTAALYLRRAGATVCILEASIPGGQLASSATVENYPGVPQINGANLAMAMMEQATGAGAVIKYEAAKSISRADDGKIIIITGKDEYSAKTLLIATGCKRRKLGAAGEDELLGQGVSYCATCDGGFFRGKSAAVCGGGNTAVEDARYLSNICSKVTLIHRRDEFRADKAEVEKLLACENVELMLNTTVEKIEKTESGLRISVNNTKSREIGSLDTAALFVAVGTEPNTSFLPQEINLDGEKAVITDKELRCAERIYAAGDVRSGAMRQIVTACADGAVASVSMLKDIEKL